VQKLKAGLEGTLRGRQQRKRFYEEDQIHRSREEPQGYRFFMLI